MDRTTIVACLSAALLLAGCSRTEPAIKIGSKNFTEQIVLGEIIAQHVEKRLRKPVERRLNLGGTLLAHQGLLTGEIDLYPEYSGTALVAILKDPSQSDPSAVFERVRSAYQSQFQIAWLDPLGINNTFAMVVRGADARDGNLATLSDAAKVQPGWRLGVGYEFEQRDDGMAALDRTYGIPWSGAPKSMDLGLLYQALQQNQVSMIAANSTDGLLSKMDLKVLDDDRHAFPPYQVSIAVRDKALEAFPGLREALQELSGKFTNEIMQNLNYQVDGEHRPVNEVAAAFLKQAGL